MAPPCYADLGKSARDLFNKGYNFGLLKVETTTTSSGSEAIEFKTAAVHTVANGRFAGNLDVKYKIPSYGVTLTEKWNTDNILGTVLEVQDQFAKNLKITLDSSYAPQIGKRSAVLKAEWFKDNVKANVDMKVDAAPVVNLSSVFERNGWMVGVSTGVDTATNKLSSTDFAFAKTGFDYSLYSYVSNGNEFGASLFHKVAHNVEVGAMLGWTIGDRAARFGLAAKYCPNKDLELKGKINNESRVAICATHYITDQLKLILSTQFGIPEMKEGGHKVGFGIEYNP